uniref:Uncharacterized protein n=1 Tax=Aquisalinus luteolus TaxID=1566827 RepID=A0A8J3A5P2_9PROT|nr:hypothetical protein GCM10011355_08090 [Aquisalinus luteolus]
MHSSPARGLPRVAVPPDDAKLYTPSTADGNLMGWRKAQVTPSAIPSATVLTMACGENSRVGMEGDKFGGVFSWEFVVPPPPLRGTSPVLTGEEWHRN